MEIKALTSDFILIDLICIPRMLNGLAHDLAKELFFEPGSFWDRDRVS